jgi:predicted phosphodiesterase
MIKTFLLSLVLGASAMQAAEKIAGGPMAVNVTSLRVEKVTYSSLKPGTVYEYEVPGNPGRKGSFKTAAEGDHPFEFVFFGDTRTRNEVHQHVVKALLQYSQPEFVIHTGDLVADGSDSTLWPVFFDIEKDLLNKVAFFPVLGNHERNSHEFYDYFQVGATPYYSFNWGNAHFIMLNSDIGNAATSPSARDAFWKEQTQWLEDDLKANQKAAYRFVVAHHPPITAVERRQGDNPHMIALMPMFEKYHVTAGLFGHDHNYQHYLKNGIHYLISGGGGAPLYDVNKPAPDITQKVISTEHFVRIRVDGETAHVEAIALDGSTLDKIELQSRP